MKIIKTWLFDWRRAQILRVQQIDVMSVSLSDVRAEPKGVVVSETETGTVEHPELREVEEKFWVSLHGPGGCMLGPFKRLEEALAKVETPKCQVTRETNWVADAKPIDSAAWTGRTKDGGTVTPLREHDPREGWDRPFSDVQKPTRTLGEAMDIRDDLLRRLTDCARDLDVLGFGGLAEDVRHARNCVRRGDKNLSAPSPLERAWEHLRQADRDLVEAKQPVLAKLAVLLRDDVGSHLSRKPVPASCADLDQADKMGRPIGTVTKAEPAGEGYPKGYTRCTVEFGSADAEHERAMERIPVTPPGQPIEWIEVPVEAVKLRKAALEEGRKEGLRQALFDIENYPTAFASGIKKSLVDLIRARIRGER